MADAVVEIDTDHGVDVVWDDALRVNPPRVWLITSGDVDGATNGDARVGLFTHGAEVASDLPYLAFANVAIHVYWFSERLVVFGKTLNWCRARGRNEVP